MLQQAVGLPKQLEIRGVQVGWCRGSESKPAVRPLINHAYYMAFRIILSHNVAHPDNGRPCYLLPKHFQKHTDRGGSNYRRVDFDFNSFVSKNTRVNWPCQINVQPIGFIQKLVLRAIPALRWLTPNSCRQ